MKWDGRMLAGFDLETTSADPEEARILTAAIPVWRDGQITIRSARVNPGVPIPAEATAIHGITDAHAAQWAPPATILPTLIADLTRLAATMPVVVFNAPYDLTVLDREARRHGVEPLDLSGALIVDPLVIDKQCDRYRKGKRTLGAMCAHHGVDLDGAHEAETDAVAAMRLAWKLRAAHPFLGYTGDLMGYQTRARAAQSRSLQAYFDRKGQAETVRTEWPVIPYQEAA